MESCALREKGNKKKIIQQCIVLLGCGGFVCCNGRYDKRCS